MAVLLKNIASDIILIVQATVRQLITKAVGEPTIFSLAH